MIDASLVNYTLQVGNIYKYNNASYMCLEIIALNRKTNEYLLCRVGDGWTMKVKDIVLDSTNQIKFYSHSTGGFFLEDKKLSSLIYK